MAPNISKRRLGTKEVSQTFATFDELIAAIKEQMTKADKMVLRLNWYIGLQAWIVQSNAVYGDHSILEFAEKIGLSSSSVYEAKRFYETYSRDDLENRLVPHEIPYRRALALLRCSDEEQRNIIEQASYELGLADEQISELVKRANKKELLPADMVEMGALVSTLKEDALKDDDPNYVDDGDDDDEHEGEGGELGTGPSDMQNATADPNNERAGVKALSGSCGRFSKVIGELTEASNDLANRVEVLSSLTGINYAKAERRLIAMLDDIQAGMGVLYSANKNLADHNIVTRK